jgi:DNA-directed RNA polymerase specialized sigma24 family protein
MPHRKREASASYHAAVSAEEKLARLLGLLLVKDMKSKSDQVTLLRRAGFEVSEVASLLDMTENNVMVTDHLGRKKVD